MRTTISMILAAFLFTTFMPLAATADDYIDAQLRITRQPRSDLEVYVWPDRGEGGVYYPGDRININVQATRDCFLILYNLDTEGRLHILYPEDPWQDNFISAGEQISFPGPYSDYDWTVEGPSGTEYVQVIASEIPINPPEWPVYQRSVRSGGYFGAELRNFRAPSDRIGYIDVVNRNICGNYWDWAATDLASFYVHPRPIYRHVNVIDPWPSAFYGSVYIGWPLGSRVYIDGIFIGIAPCYIPRTYIGRRVITCYDGPRIIHRQTVHIYPKRDYYRHHSNPWGHREHVRVKKARPGAFEHFDIQRDVKGKRFKAVEKSRIGRNDDLRQAPSQFKLDNRSGKQSARKEVIKGRADNAPRIESTNKPARQEARREVRVNPGKPTAVEKPRMTSNSKGSARVERAPAKVRREVAIQRQSQPERTSIDRGDAKREAKSTIRVERSRTDIAKVSKAAKPQSRDKATKQKGAGKSDGSQKLRTEAKGRRN